MNVYMHHDNVLVSETQRAARRFGSTSLPGETKPEQVMGKVIAVGPAASSVGTNENVTFMRKSGTLISFEGQDYWIVSDCHILFSFEEKNESNVSETSNND